MYSALTGSGRGSNCSHLTTRETQHQTYEVSPYWHLTSLEQCHTFLSLVSIFQIPNSCTDPRQWTEFTPRFLHPRSRVWGVWLIVWQLPIKAGWRDAPLALRNFSRSNKHNVTINPAGYTSITSSSSLGNFSTHHNTFFSSLHFPHSMPFSFCLPLRSHFVFVWFSLPFLSLTLELKLHGILSAYMYI